MYADCKKLSFFAVRFYLCVIIYFQYIIVVTLLGVIVRVSSAENSLSSRFLFSSVTHIANFRIFQHN